MSPRKRKATGNPPMAVHALRTARLPQSWPMSALPPDCFARRAPKKRCAYPPIVEGMPPETLVKLAQVIGDTQTPGLLPVSRGMWYRLIHQGRAPAPIKPLGGKASYWVLGDVLEAVRRLKDDGADKPFHETPLMRKRAASTAI